MHFDDGIKLAVIKTKVIALRSMVSSYYEELSDKKNKKSWRECYDYKDYYDTLISFRWGITWGLFVVNLLT